MTKCQVSSSKLDILSSFWSIMSSFAPHNNFYIFRNSLHLLLSTRNKFVSQILLKALTKAFSNNANRYAFSEVFHASGEIFGTNRKFGTTSKLRKEVIFQKGRKGAGVKGAGVANCRIFRSAVPSVAVWSILLVSLSGVRKKL